MWTFEENTLEKAFQDFADKNFEPPKSCENMGQVKFYIQELYSKIEELSTNFNYVPMNAFILLSHYNAVRKQLTRYGLNEN